MTGDIHILNISWVNVQFVTKTTQKTKYMVQDLYWSCQHFVTLLITLLQTTFL